MLIDDVERYLTVRRATGYKAAHLAQSLPAFARFAAAKGDLHVKAATAVDWAATGYSPVQRRRHLHEVVRLAQFLRAEDIAHEIPPTKLFAARSARPTPYIYTGEEVALILEKAGQLRPNIITPLRPKMYVMLFGLIAATGLRTSEALRLTFDDILPGGVLRIRESKFGKTRLVPLHESVVVALDRYLETRRRLATLDRHLFVGRGSRRLALNAAECVFALVLRQAKIAPNRRRRPRITDLRHTFATRVLEQCATRRDAVSRHFVALSTYMGHTCVAHTYWYLQATPELMTDIAAVAEAHVAGRSA
ncbi:MAG: tyrosine-type recombinase/integrase [Alphaproteobacteria bacterium]|nr:tyrosine-type recombinase/integrase [Alphaproteobacteria bacterium]